MIPLKTIEELIGKHALLEKELSSGSLDKKSFAEKSKEYSDLNEIVDDAKKYSSYENDKLYMLEINTQPGMTETSLSPEQAMFCNITLKNMVKIIIEGASYEC